jgi:hypothetical protein
MQVDRRTIRLAVVTGVSAFVVITIVFGATAIVVIIVAPA